MSSKTDLVTATVKLGGRAIDENIGIQALSVSTSINQIATAELQLILPASSGSLNPFSLARDEQYAPGKEVEILLGYNSKEESVFKGIIVTQQFHGDAAENSLSLQCSHKAVQLTKDTGTATWYDKKVTDAISELISNAGLRKEVESVGNTEEVIVQYQRTAWDFIRKRATDQGLLVYTDGDETKVKEPLASGVSDLVLTYGKDVLSYELAQDDSSAKQGSLTFFGNAKPRLNSMIQLSGFGKTFSGDVLITEVDHEVKAGVWQTSISFGLAMDSQVNIAQVESGFSSMPEVSGLLLGTVKKIDADPAGEHRIQVDIPTVGDTWADLANPYSTNRKGVFFVPEIGDEIVLGFLNGHSSHPIILGSLYSSRNVPPYTADAENTIKAIVTKNDLKLEFNDKDKVLTIETPAGNSFVLSDKDKSITTQDQNGNEIVMDTAGISINSAKDITIKAGGKIDINANQAISTKTSGGDVAIQGLNVNLKAQVALSAQGSASAELKASGQTSVKGAMVMIN